MRYLAVTGPGSVALLDDTPLGPLDAGCFDVRTWYSGVSAGTELSIINHTNPMLTSRFDPELRLFTPRSAGDCRAPSRFGYMEVGEVVESQTPAVRPGTLVAMAYGHRTHHRADPLADRFIALPADLDPVLGIYLAHMGPICANGLLHAAAETYGPAVRSLADGVRGVRVVVTGCGVVGLLTALFARLHGAASVVLIDPAEYRRGVAVALGLETMDPRAEDAAVALKTRWRHGPGDRGADVVFQCRGRAESLALALRALRPQGTVIDLAFYQEGGDAVRLGEEFHHNGLTIRCAQIGHVPRGAAHLWDRERLSLATLDLLRTDGEAITRHLVTTLVPFTDAPAFFSDLATRRRTVLQAVLTCREDQ